MNILTISWWPPLNRKYSELLEEYKTLRRCFSVSAQVPYTDVWTHKPVHFYPGKHPSEKPADMLKQIISASSRSGDIVVDFFMGCGSTVKAAIELGRRAIGVELEADRFFETVREVEEMDRTLISLCYRFVFFIIGKMVAAGSSDVLDICFCILANASLTICAALCLVQRSNSSFRNLVPQSLHSTGQKSCEL